MVHVGYELFLFFCIIKTGLLSIHNHCFFMNNVDPPSLPLSLSLSLCIAAIDGHAHPPSYSISLFCKNK